MLEIKGAKKYFNRHKKNQVCAIDDTTLTLDNNGLVALLGPSGCGKTTLLNSIGGLDKLSKGSIFIDGKKISSRFSYKVDKIRNLNVGYIFQDYKLVEDLSVYDNVSIVLKMIGIKDKNEIKKRVEYVLDKVGMLRYKKRPASMLSGGERQRVGIARAIVKDPDIILADEPTGNLDSKSALEVIKLLSEISKEKLVIIVTHNYEQVENYATRKIKMHDGRVLEDKKLKDVTLFQDNTQHKYKNISFFNKLRLSFRNTFNVVPKFLLIFLVYLFITVSIISEYAGTKELEYVSSINGYNYVFTNVNDKRIVIKKNDKSYISDKDFKTLEQLSNVSYVVKNDLLLDTSIVLMNNSDIYIDGYSYSLSLFNSKLEYGKMPSSSDEVILMCNSNNYYCKDYENLFSSSFYIENYWAEGPNKYKVDGLDKKIKVVGIAYNEDEENNYDIKIYMNDELMNDLVLNVSKSYSTTKYLFDGKYLDYASVVTSKNVPKGQVYLDESFNYSCSNFNCKGKTFTLEVSNLYYSDSLKLKTGNIYNKNNIKKLLNLSNYDDVAGSIFVNTDDYNNLYSKNIYQSSVFVKDVRKIEETINDLETLGYDTLAIKDALVSYDEVGIIRIVRTVVTIILIIVLFFISYFVIKVILKSRNKYFSTIRILGATKKVARQLLVMELFVVCNLAYLLFIVFILINKYKGLDISIMNTISNYLVLKDYIVLYVILIMMSYLISNRYARKLFKSSAITTLGEEV